MTDTQRIETCCACDVPTGKAGKHDDSLYVYHETIGDIGPFCEDCYLIEHIANAERYRQELATANARIAELTEWRPMEDAPKDRSLIIIKGSDERVVVAAWGNSGSGGGMGPDDFGVALHNDGKKITGDTYPIYRPIGWIPLPTTTTTTKEGDQA